MKTQQLPRRLIPIADVQRDLGVGRSTVYRLIGEGRLTRANIGRRALVTAESLDSYVSSLTRD